MKQKTLLMNFSRIFVSQRNNKNLLEGKNSNQIWKSREKKSAAMWHNNFKGVIAATMEENVFYCFELELGDSIKVTHSELNLNVESLIIDSY